MYFLTGEHEVLAPLFGEGGMRFHEVEEVQQRIQRIIDLMRKRSRKLALGAGRCCTSFVCSLGPKT